MVRYLGMRFDDLGAVSSPSATWARGRLFGRTLRGGRAQSTNLAQQAK